MEKVNISGYEGNYDDFVCMCFFTFENIFDLNNKFGMKTDEAFKRIGAKKYGKLFKKYNASIIKELNEVKGIFKGRKRRKIMYYIVNNFKTLFDIAI